MGDSAAVERRPREDEIECPARNDEIVVEERQGGLRKEESRMRRMAFERVRQGVTGLRSDVAVRVGLYTHREHVTIRGTDGLGALQRDLRLLGVTQPRFELGDDDQRGDVVGRL